LLFLSFVIFFIHWHKLLWEVGNHSEVLEEATVLKDACSSSKSLSFNENFVTLDANDWLSDSGVESVDDLLSCSVIVEWVLLLGKI
jgi:hypothetical protein